MTNDAPAQASVEAAPMHNPEEPDFITTLTGAASMAESEARDETDEGKAWSLKFLAGKLRGAAFVITTQRTRLAPLSPPPTVGAEDEVPINQAARAIAHRRDAWKPGERVAPDYLRDASAAVHAYLSACPTRPSPSAAEVKGLEWVDCDFAGSATVQEIGLTYTMQNGRDGWFVAVTGAGISVYLPGYFGSRDEAKAAAQADYEQRIRSCLALPEGGRGSAKGRV